MKPPTDTGYIVLDLARADAHACDVATGVVRKLGALGWTQCWSVADLTVLTAPGKRVAVSMVGSRHFLIGDWHPGGARSLSALVGLNPQALDLARAVVSGGWGKYVFVWRDHDGILHALRDPSGAIDCIHWRRDGLGVITDQWPEEADVLLPREVAVDWQGLSRMVDQPQYSVRHVALTGLETLDAGCLVRPGPQTSCQTIWRPAAFYGGQYAPEPEALREVVDQTVATLTGGCPSVVAELSGGLDSAIAVGSLHAAGRTAGFSLVNYYGPWIEGDERLYARPMAQRLGVSLDEVAKPLEAVPADALARLGLGPRPALQGVDTTYDADMAERLSSREAVSLTGQGGDAVFFQQATPWIARDRFQRRDPGALDPFWLSSLGRWTRRSAWAVAAVAVREPAVPVDEADDDHPWLGGLAGIPPAKRMQIRQLANCQVFWRDCLRARAAPLVHPFLTQPVMEHCLAIPVDILTKGARDRGLAREAFGDRLPDAIRNRRNKGDLTRYYGRINQLSLPMLRDHLLDGCLATQGVLDKGDLAEVLTDERLIWDGQHNRIMLPAVLESWARNWEGRLRRSR